MHDAIGYYDSALQELRRLKPLHFNHRSLRCDSSNKWLFGPALMRFLKNVRVLSLTK